MSEELKISIPEQLDHTITTGTLHGDQLCCPSCGSPYGMQHGAVEVWNRNAEDAMKGTYLRSNSPLIVDTAANVDHRNPSLRRNGVIINFRCEMCPEKRFELSIAQHKGTTFLSWVIVSKKEE